MLRMDPIGTGEGLAVRCPGRKQGLEVRQPSAYSGGKMTFTTLVAVQRPKCLI